MRTRVAAPCHVNVDLIARQLQLVHMTKLLPVFYQVHSSFTSLAVVPTQLGHTMARFQELCSHGSQCLLSAQASWLCQVSITSSRLQEN